MKANIKLSVLRQRPEAVLALARNVVGKMSGNANFITPAVTMADMTAAADALETAIEEATFGSRQSKLLRNDAKNALSTLLRKQADYVRSICLGNATMLDSSGYPLAKTPEPVGVPGTTKELTARFTNLRGEVELRWRRVHGAHGYQVWMTSEDPALPNAKWEAIAYRTQVSHLVTDLESFKAYWFCVSAIGTAGEGAQCDPAMGRAA